MEALSFRSVPVGEGQEQFHLGMLALQPRLTSLSLRYTQLATPN